MYYKVNERGMISNILKEKRHFERIMEFRYYYNKRLMVLSVPILILLAMMMLVIGNLNPQGVYSHANPTSYTPPSNSVVGVDGTIPEKVMIVFSERPEPKVSYIRVTNAENERVDKNDFGVSVNNPRESSVSLDTSKMNPGIYTVSWLALSRDDGHITKGSYVFTVSTGPNATVLNSDTMVGSNFTDSIVVDNINITFKIFPFLSGINNNFSVSLSGPDGNPLTNIKTVFLIFSNKQAGLGPISTELAKVNEGEYSGAGAYLSQAGRWEVKITVQRTNAYDLNHNFIFDIQNPP